MRSLPDNLSNGLKMVSRYAGSTPGPAASEPAAGRALTGGQADASAARAARSNGEAGRPGRGDGPAVGGREPPYRLRLRGDVRRGLRSAGSACIVARAASCAAEPPLLNVSDLALALALPLAPWLVPLGAHSYS